jgi:xanthine dehydrogenase YagS FAD-binding subunit
MAGFDYLVAERLDAALAELAENKPTLKAGGYDLLDLVKEGIESPKVVLSIDRLDELRYVREDDAGLHIGALTTLADLARSEALKTKYPALHTAAAHAATPQVRERATVGGNLCQRPRCWYFRNVEFNCLKKGGSTCFAVEGENQYHAIFGGGPCHIVHPSNLAPALVALDARIVLAEHGKPDATVRVEELFVLPKQSMYAETTLKPGQVIREVLIPKPPSQSATIELREKQSFDWPIMLASVARVDGNWRVCLGACAPVPWLSVPAMKSLGNADVTPQRAEEAGVAAASEATPMSGNAYKVQLVKVAVKRALLHAVGLEVPS